MVTGIDSLALVDRARALAYLRQPIPSAQESTMARWPKPPEGSWTQHYPELGTEPVSYEDSISPAFYELERQAIFKRVWLNVGRVELLPRDGSYFTKELR